MELTTSRGAIVADLTTRIVAAVVVLKLALALVLALVLRGLPVLRGLLTMLTMLTMLAMLAMLLLLLWLLTSLILPTVAASPTLKTDKSVIGRFSNVVDVLTTAAILAIIFANKDMATNTLETDEGSTHLEMLGLRVMLLLLLLGLVLLVYLPASL